MITSTSSGGVESVNSSSLPGVVRVFQTRELDEKSQISSLSMKEFLMWAAEVDTASPQQSVAVLKPMMETKRSQKFGTILADTNDPFLRKAGTDQIRQFLRSSIAVETYAVCDDRVAQ